MSKIIENVILKIYVIILKQICNDIYNSNNNIVNNTLFNSIEL